MGTDERPREIDVGAASPAQRRQVPLGPSPFAEDGLFYSPVTGFSGAQGESEDGDAKASPAEAESSPMPSTNAKETNKPVKRRGEWSTHTIPVAQPTVEVPRPPDPVEAEIVSAAGAAESASGGRKRRQVRMARVSSRRVAWGVVLGGAALLAVIIMLAIWSMGNSSKTPNPTQSQSPNASTLSSKPHDTPSATTSTAPSAVLPEPPVIEGDGGADGETGTAVELTAIGTRVGDEVTITVVLTSDSIPVNGIGVTATWPDGVNSRCITVKGRCTTGAVTQAARAIVTVGSTAELGYASGLVKIEV